METFSFIARMPDEPGKLHAAAKVIAEHGGNIRRISFDRNIDQMTVFFEVLSAPKDYDKIMGSLERLGYLQTVLKKSNYLKFDIYLPHRAGALYDFLNHTSSAGANIAFLDFDDRGSHPDRLTVGLTLGDNGRIASLMDSLKSRFRIEILEYDASGKRLDDAVFYVRFAGELREVLGEKEDAFLLRLLHDINHVAQELAALGEDPKRAFESILSTGRALKKTAGGGFYSDVQKIQVSPDVSLFCFQMPCGGNIYAFDAPDEKVLIDTGYGIYYKDVRQMLQRYLSGNTDISRVYVTHADSDHAGALGFYGCPEYMHPGTLEVLEKSNRAYRSKTEKSILEEIYTKLINMFSENTAPVNPILFKEKKTLMRGLFPIIGRFTIGGIEFSALESMGGHMHAQTFFLSDEHKLLFTGDSLMPFESLTDERKRYNLHAKNIMTSVNVDSAKAVAEREALMELASGIDGCIICPGHGALSKITNGKLETCGAIERYVHKM